MYPLTGSSILVSRIIWMLAMSLPKKKATCPLDSEHWWRIDAVLHPSHTIPAFVRDVSDERWDRRWSMRCSCLNIPGVCCTNCATVVDWRWCEACCQPDLLPTNPLMSHQLKSVVWEWKSLFGFFDFLSEATLSRKRATDLGRSVDSFMKILYYTCSLGTWWTLVLDRRHQVHQRPRLCEYLSSGNDPRSMCFFHLRLITFYRFQPFWRVCQAMGFPTNRCLLSPQMQRLWSMWWPNFVVKIAFVVWTAVTLFLWTPVEHPFPSAAGWWQLSGWPWIKSVTQTVHVHQHVMLSLALADPSGHQPEGDKILLPSLSRQKSSQESASSDPWPVSSPASPS